jgi:MFS transporter, PPP family, 3-phenylpropionic acid transporter
MIPERTRAGLRQISVITFLTFAARGFTLPFIYIYLESVGFSATQIGVLMTISALFQLIVPPALHALADRTEKHRRLYYGLLTMNALASFSVASVANPLLVGGSVIVRDSVDSPSASLLSQLTISWLDQRKLTIYGRLRAWGSLGWAVTTFISGRIIASGGYPLLFISTGVINLLLIPLVKVLPERVANRREYKGNIAPRPTVFYAVLVSFFLFAFGNNAISVFSFIYFKQNLGASNDLIGIISSVAALSEIPAMVLMDRLLRRTSISTTLAAGILGQGMLWVSYSLLTGSTLLIPLMMIRGTFFTFFNVSATLLISRISHPLNAATNQALAQVTVPSLAFLVAGTVNGWLFDNAGPHILFQVAGMMAMLSAILLFAARRYISVQDQKMTVLQENTVVTPTG